MVKKHPILSRHGIARSHLELELAEPQHAGDRARERGALVVGEGRSHGEQDSSSEVGYRMTEYI